MLGAGCWSSSLQCAVERHAIGHRRHRHRRCTLSSLSSSHRALSLSHRACRRRRAVPSCRAPRRRHMPSSSSPCVVVVVAPSSRRALRCCAPLLHCRAVVALLDPPSSSPSVVVTAPSPLSCCRVLSPWCHWAPSLHRLRIAGPAAVAVRCCRALYPSCCTPLPSCCVHLRRHAVVCCRHRRARCACLARLVSVLWCGAWAVGLSMGWWRGRCWGPLRVACMAVVVAVHCRHCRRFVVSRDRHCALVRDAWALQPGGGWLRGVALAPPDCGGGCALWWALVVVARAVGCWAIGTARLCAAPGPLGPVEGG